MSLVKSKVEIEKLKKSGDVTSRTLRKVIKNIQPGISTLELDNIAYDQIIKLGGKPSFKTVEGYQHTICSTVNDEVVHGVPSGYKLKQSDIIGIDVGAVWQGYHSDMAETIPVGTVDVKILDFLQTGKVALNKAINAAREKNHIGDISDRIQTVIEKAGYSVVHELSGHGVGKNLHEEPSIPCFGKKGNGIEIKSGMTLAIEVIYTMGEREIKYKNNDGWTIVSKDGSLGGLFERTVLVTKVDPIVLTPLN